MKNPYHSWILKFAKLLAEGVGLPLGGLTPARHVSVPANAPRVLLFSPHPDDETITGALPLRLLRELQMNVINVAVTLGRNKERRNHRWKELKRACEYLGFGLVKASENGLEGVYVNTRESEPEVWVEAVDIVAKILSENQPLIVFVPHEEDCHPNHVGTHYLLKDALGRMPPGFGCYVVETEFWHPMGTPNLLVESSADDVADLVAALSFHAGEVVRNPYHIRLPAWMADNVRRGGELVGGWGEAPPDFTFSTLYRLRQWHRMELKEVFDRGRNISSRDNLRELLLEPT